VVGQHASCPVPAHRVALHLGGGGMGGGAGVGGPQIPGEIFIQKLSLAPH